MTKASGVSESRESRSLGSLGVLGVSGVSESQTVNCTIAILAACRMLQISIAQRQMKAKIHSFPTMYILGGVDVVEMGQIKVFVQELGLKTTKS